MKKLMLIVAAIAVTATVQAASCNWTVMGIGADPDGGAFTSYYAYLCDASVTSLGDMTTALSNGDVSLLSGSTVVRSAATLAQGTTAARVNVTGIGDYAAGTTVEYYTIILNNATASDATYYMATSAIQGTAPTAGVMAMQFGSQASNSWQATAVPEPTSGLLVLLGMAGLALRRRRA